MKKLMNTVLQIVIFFFGWIALVAIGSSFPIQNPAPWRLWAEAEPLLAMLVLTAIFLKINKGEVTIPVRDNLGRGILAGTISGICWIGLSAGILFGIGAYSFTGRNNVEHLGIWILAAFLNVIMQELLIHGFIYCFLKERYNLASAVIVTTAMFTLLHGGAVEAGIVPVLNVVTMCLFVTALYEAEKTIWAPILPHAIWNITGSIILGIDNLADDYPSLYSVKVSSNTLLSGGKVKLSGSIVVLVINIAFGLFFLWVCRKQWKQV